MNPDLELKLQALADGELTEPEAARVRRLAASDPHAGRLLAETQYLKAAFLDNELTVPVPETREFYWSKIARQIERQERSRPSPALPWPARLRRLLAPLAGVAALAVVLLAALNLSAPQAAINRVCVTAEGFEAHTFRDQSSGLTFVYLRETQKPLPARTREDGSSFILDYE